MDRKLKHKAIYDDLRESIRAGRYAVGDRLPSEVDLVAQFAASRPTVARALRELQAEGVIERRVGSGTYVCRPPEPPTTGRMFGLLIPELGRTEIFEPICGAIARRMQAQRHALLWGDFTSGDGDDRIPQAQQTCAEYIDRKPAGVFFAPIELAEGMEQVNARIVEAFRHAAIPLVLLDRDAAAYPKRCGCDVVGIDNALGGYRLTEHLISVGCRRIAFIARPLSAPTVAQRVAGYREALRAAGLRAESRLVQFGDPEDAGFVRRLLRTAKPEAMVCANDLTAARLMHTLDALGVAVPNDIGVVGFDDVKYAKLVRVPLTTMHQPCDAIGAAAVNAMLERVADPQLPPRQILLEPTLVVRRSCGSPSPSRPR